MIALVLFVSICLLSMCSGYRKGPDEDDGFWEVYNMYWRTHIVISMCLAVIVALFEAQSLPGARTRASVVAPAGLALAVLGMLLALASARPALGAP